MSKLRNASRIFVGHQEEKRHVFAPVQGSSAAYFRIYENELHVYNHVRKCRCGIDAECRIESPITMVAKTTVEK